MTNSSSYVKELTVKFARESTTGPLIQAEQINTLWLKFGIFDRTESPRESLNFVKKSKTISAGIN